MNDIQHKIATEKIKGTKGCKTDRKQLTIWQQ